MKNSDYSSVVKELERNLETEYGVEIDLYYSKSTNSIELSKIIIPKDKRNQGIGQSVMNKLCEFLDEHSFRMTLTPSGDFGGTKSRLNLFYKKFGFVPYKGFEFKNTMIRIPK